MYAAPIGHAHAYRFASGRCVIVRYAWNMRYVIERGLWKAVNVRTETRFDN